MLPWPSQSHLWAPRGSFTHGGTGTRCHHPSSRASSSWGTLGTLPGFRGAVGTAGTDVDGQTATGALGAGGGWGSLGVHWGQFWGQFWGVQGAVPFLAHSWHLSSLTSGPQGSRFALLEYSMSSRKRIPKREFIHFISNIWPGWGPQLRQGQAALAGQGWHYSWHRTGSASPQSPSEPLLCRLCPTQLLWRKYFIALGSWIAFDLESFPKVQRSQ